jgi:A/G-specific adenine glycosylase
LSWSLAHPSRFPWRVGKDSFKILLAELFLRRTTRKQVDSLFEKLFEKYHSPRSLALASLGTLASDIRPLGLQYTRAMTLRRLGMELIQKHDGRVPADRYQLMQLPGVGEYTADAVRCLAFGEHVPLLDTNAVRVLSRVFSLKSKKKEPRKDSDLWKFEREIIPGRKAKEFNIAMLDFADAVCTTLKPRCRHCPLNDICTYGLRVLRR